VHTPVDQEPLWMRDNDNGDSLSFSSGHPMSASTTTTP
jgi:hypothetical protein